MLTATKIRLYPTAEQEQLLAAQFGCARFVWNRTWLCTACGTLHDRDENAAENIRRQGILKLKAEGLSVSAHGGGVSRVPSAPATADEVGSLRLQA